MDAVLFLSPLLIGAVILLMVILIAVAAMQGGYARMVTDRLNRRWSMLLVAVLATGFVVTMQQLSGWLMKLVDMTQGDQVWIAAVITMWLLVIVYVGKVPLDRARDLWARHYEERRLAEARRRGRFQLSSPRRWLVRDRRSRRAWTDISRKPE